MGQPRGPSLHGACAVVVQQGVLPIGTWILICRKYVLRWWTPWKPTYYLDVFSCKHAFSVKKVPQERVQLESPASVTVHHSIVDANASYMRSHNPLTWTGCTCSVKTRMGWVMWTVLACQMAFAHERHHALLVSGEGKRESQVDYQLSAALCVFKALTWLYSLPPETTALGCQWTWIKARCAFHARKAMTWQRRICFEGECWLKLCWMTCCCVHQWLYGILVALAMAKEPWCGLLPCVGTWRCLAILHLTKYGQLVGSCCLLYRVYTFTKVFSIIIVTNFMRIHCTLSPLLPPMRPGIEWFSALTRCCAIRGINGTIY